MHNLAPYTTAISICTLQPNVIIQSHLGHKTQGVIQQLRGQNFAIFLTPPPCVDSFYTRSMDKNIFFFTPSPLHAVIE